MRKSRQGRIRRICYIDAALMSNVGHHANACRYIAGQIRRRGIEVGLLANGTVVSELGDELRARGLFRHNSYTRIVRRRSVNFLLAQASFLADLNETTHGDRYDLVYVNSVFPAQMAAIIHWGQTRFSAANMPPIVMEFAFPSDVSDQCTGSWGQYTKQYPAAALKLTRDCSGKFLFFTFDPAASREYSGVLGFDVEALPAIYTGGEIRLRTGGEKGQPVVGFLGHQRMDKGYYLLPELRHSLLEKDVPARFLVHNGDVNNTDTDRALRELATADRRVCFVQRAADQNYWNILLDHTDICVLPYEPNHYMASVSAVAVEAVSCGLPIVSPNGTTMKTLAERYQNNPRGIANWTVEAVADAVVEAVGDFPNFAQSAYQGAQRWVREIGAVPLVSRVLEFADTCTTVESRTPSHPNDVAMRFMSYVAKAKLRHRVAQRRRRERRRLSRTA